MRIRLPVVAALLGGALTACSGRSPYVVLTVDDPAAVATAADRLLVGESVDTLTPVTLARLQFPVTLTVTAGSAGERTLWVEARDAAGAPLARGTTSARFARTGTPTATVALGRVCNADVDCDDQQFCTGAEACADGICAPGVGPCAANVECATSTCLELGGGAGRCDTQVFHEQCGTGRYCNPVRGCVEGRGCLEDVDCRDDYVCNGDERCINLVCTPGAPPVVDDGDSCTVDGCDDGRTALGAEAVFHVALTSFDGSACTLPSSGLAGVCVAARGGCVESTCGDGVIGPAEQCEDGNLDPNDGCDDCRRTRWRAAVLVGNGEGQGRATGLALHIPSGVAADRDGNVYVVDSFAHVVRRVDAATGRITTVAGTGAAGSTGDGGPATSASLNLPMDVEVDGSGNLFVVDLYSSRIRRIDAGTGVIHTVAGTGTSGFSGDGGPATAAELSQVYGVAVDGSGNLYFTDTQNNRVRRVAAATGLITTIAGDGTQASTGDDGLATAASLYTPTGITVDVEGHVFIADNGGRRIRRVDAVTNTITTVVGTGSMGSSGDLGPGVAATLSSPRGLSVDGHGNLYLADAWASRIRRLDHVSGIITTVAGTGSQGSSGDGGAATSAALGSPNGVAVDSAGNLYIADSGNNRVRRVDAVSATISTVVGTGLAGFSGDGGPATSAVLSRPTWAVGDAAGNVWIADTYHHQIRRVDATTGLITTVAGNGALGYSCDDCPAVSASLAVPGSVVLDGSGNLLIADTANGRIRRVDATTGLITTVAGNGDEDYSGDGGPATAAALSSPACAVFDSAGNLYIADSDNGRVRRVDASTGIITTVAGDGSSGDDGDDGPAIFAELSAPLGIVVDGAGNLYIADSDNARIRRVDGTSGIITTVAGTGNPTGSSGDGGPATDAKLNFPTGVSLDGDGNLLIADSVNHRIRRVAKATGLITTLVGASAGFAGDGGGLGPARLNQPGSVLPDPAGNLLIADTYNDRVRRIDVATGVITTVAGNVDPMGDQALVSSVLGQPHAAVEVAAGKWLVADGASGRVREVDVAAGWVRSRVGYPEGFAGDGIAARYSRLFADARGIAWDPVGASLFVSEYGAHTLQVVDLAATPWTIATFAGAVGSAGYADATGTTARFTSPAGLLFDPTARTLLVADAGNHVIRSVAVDTGAVSTLAGTPRFRGYFGEEVDARDALFNQPQALAFGNDGSLYVADTGNHRVRRIDGDGVIHLVLGDGSAASSGEGGPARFFPVDAPAGLAVDAFGNLFVSSATALRLVVAGADGVATGDDEVVTVYGRPPRAQFPEPVTFCLAGVSVLPGDGGATDARLYLLDACAGFLLQLDRERL